MQDEPSAGQLAEAVKSFLETVAMPNLEGHAGFHARVAANAMGILVRELAQGPAAEAAERHRLHKLTGEPAAMDLIAHNELLCKLIREERLELDNPLLIDHLRRTTLAKVEIDQPTYSGLKTAKDTWAKTL